MKSLVKRLFHTSMSDGDEGQGMVEYGLIVSLMAVLVISIMVTLGPTIRDMFTNTVDDEAVGEREATLSSTIYS